MNWQRTKLLILAVCFILFSFLTILKIKDSVNNSIERTHLKTDNFKKNKISSSKYIVEFNDNINKIKNFNYPDKWIDKPEIFSKGFK